MKEASEIGSKDTKYVCIDKSDNNWSSNTNIYISINVNNCKNLSFYGHIYIYICRDHIVRWVPISDHIHSYDTHIYIYANDHIWSLIWIYIYICVWLYNYTVITVTFSYEICQSTQDVSAHHCIMILVSITTGGPFIAVCFVSGASWWSKERPASWRNSTRKGWEVKWEMCFFGYKKCRYDYT